MSGFVATIARGQLRRQWAALLALAIVVALGGGVALGAAIAADRTDRAYPDYVDRADVTELVINPSLSSQAMADAIENFDGVRSVHSNSLMAAQIGNVQPAPLGELAGSEPWLQVLGSPDGRWLDVDRPAVTSGRLPTGDHELFVSEEVRELLESVVGHDVAVGDTVDLSFFWSGLFEGEIDYSATVAPIGVETLRISGFGVLPDEVLPDELWPRQRLIVSTDVARKYVCTAEFNAGMTDEEALAAAFPQDCATQYTYYSLHLEVGDNTAATAASIRGQFAEAADVLTGDLPPIVADAGAGYYFVSQDRADTDDAVERAVRPTVTSLNFFAVVALLASIAVFGVAVARVVRRAETESLRLRELGATTPQRVAAAWLPVVAAICVGVTGAVGVGALLSPIGPVGSVRALVSAPGISLPVRVAAALMVPFAVLLLVTSSAVVFAMARRNSGRSTKPVQRATRLSRAASGLRRPAISTGTKAALEVGRPGTAAAIVGCVVAVFSVGGALIFDSNLRQLVRDPDEYGWPWDVSMIIGAGYGGAQPDSIARSLSEHPDVVSYEIYGLDPSTQFGEQGVPVLYGFSDFPVPPFPVIAGRAPRTENEAVLGSNTARRLSAEVGDYIALQSTTFGNREVLVVGTAVLPTIGPFVSDRMGLGDGAFVILEEPPNSASSFVGVSLRDGTDPQAFVDGIAGDDALASWSDLSEPPLILTGPVRSAEIINVSELRSAPIILIRLLGVALFTGFALSIVISVRDRQRELAILRVLGFRDGDLRSSVRWQALMMMLVGLIVGVPLGILAGREAWRAFAEQLGVAPKVSIGTVIGSLLLAVLAALVPARSATRTKSGLVLRR